MPMRVFKTIWLAGVCEQCLSHLPNTRWDWEMCFGGSVVECLPKYAKLGMWI